MLAASEVAWNVDGLEKFFAENMTAHGNLRRLADVWEEPMALGGMMGARSLRHEVLRRLQSLKERHEAEGREVPRAAEIESAWTQPLGLRASGEYLVPGPAELHLPASEAMPETLANSITELWAEEDYVGAMNMAARASQFFLVDERDLKKTREVLESATVKVIEISFEDVLAHLFPASIIAASAGDSGIADGVAAVAKRMAAAVSRAEEVAQIMRVLLQAAAGYRLNGRRMDWLEVRFVELASELPSGSAEALQYLMLQLEVIETVLPVESWFHLSAKRAAATGPVALTQ